MRKLALTVLLVATGIACESETPLGPGVVKLTQSTSTTTSTTTSTIPPSTKADFIFSPLTPAALEVVSFNSFGSTPAPGRTLVSFVWDFGDGQSKTGVSVTHDFFPQGLYIVTLTVTDSAGESASVSRPIGAGVPLPSTTTTVPLTNTQVRYVNTQAGPDIPADLTLFFQLITTAPITPSARTRLGNLTGLSDPTFGALADSRYGVRGVYTTLSGRTGTIEGVIVGTLTPAPSGTFTGSLTANMPGCTARREFSGTLSSGSLNWTAGNMVSNTCGTNPLDFPSMTLLKSDTQSPIPLPTTTTTSSITTTSVLCNYSLSPVSVTLEARGTPGSNFQTSSVGIITTAGCGWNMQTSTPWITLVSPTVGTGPATVSFQVANNTDGQRRVGSIVIAGITFLVAQNPPPVDLAAFVPSPAAGYCTRPDGLEFMLGVRNQGTAGAPTFDTTVTFTSTSGAVPSTVTTPALAAGSSTVLTFQVPVICQKLACSFSFAVDPNNVVPEASENNNSDQGDCPAPFSTG